MSLNKIEFTQYIKQFDFNGLFIDLGWNNDKYTESVVVDKQVYQLSSVAEKSGFKVMVCNANSDDDIPDYNTRRRIESQFTKLKNLHLIIYINAKKSEQIWQLVVRKSGKPTKVTETRYSINQSPELLFQRTAGLFFDIDEEDNITIIDVTQKVDANFHANTEKVTKQFYDKFKKEHTSFLTFIKGIDNKINKDWYASLMLNRLMFCYFIQKKYFLDNNKDYLRSKLKATSDKKGKNKFYSFYRNFLLTLFHQGLGAPNHSEDVKKEIGKIPYLNGGLFDVHELETDYPIIEIEDKAFEKIFDFFDQYEWHLDTRVTSTGKDINPDVIGFIFEKYINERAEMGAYYTKEDITEYITKNSVIPYLFNETQNNYSEGFTKGSEIWNSLKISGDKYIYEALKYGFENNLPKEISKGITNVNFREEWNKPAPTEVALPTEIWREVIERKEKYEKIKQLLQDGSICSINDLITYNLDIRQFTQDVIHDTNDAEFLKQFYKSLNSVTIIDPTCGSGAFLFSAMNILEPLYEECIQRMENFILEAPKGKYKYFEEVIKYVKSPDHPNLQYFIFKSIILRNLYGVDIMKEAVEISKLRLFLKLVSTVDADYRKPNLGLEPLPDIDFNIRSGNTLVGFSTDIELKNALDYTFDGAEKKEIVTEKMEKVAKTFEHYKKIQLSNGDDFKDLKKAKDKLLVELKGLNFELNQFLALPYGIDSSKPKVFNKWLSECLPFHWFAEFYEIIHDKGGFDVVIGNPPYVSVKDVKYAPKYFSTLPCGDIYALCVERSINSLLNSNGRIGMIVPISIASTDGYSTLREVCVDSKQAFYFSNFGVRPSKLFDGVDKRLTIFISAGIKSNQFYSTKYYRWVSDERDNLFQKLAYVQVSCDLFSISGYPKISSNIEQSILKSLAKKKKSLANFIVKLSDHKVRYTRKLQYFIQFFETPPIIYDSKKKVILPSELKEIDLDNSTQKGITLAALNSSLFFWFFITFSDCRNVNSREILKFPIDIDGFDKESSDELKRLSKELMKDFKDNSVFQVRNDKKAGLLEIESFQPRHSKSLIDKIDKILSKHYGFSDEELDFIINYDIKYRLGKDFEGEE